MYIWDALYGKIEFSPLVVRCMLSPEIQRLREVRLCNINSLCLTGCSNISRYEHSVGTAYLANENINSCVQENLRLSKQEKEVFVLSALLHDVANGPFGHSYEYIRAKGGFVPERGIDDILSIEGIGANKVIHKFSPIYFGKLKALNRLLSAEQQKSISQIIAGSHPLSELISAQIDLDNIDNVFRMAYHMGLTFRREAPLKLAHSMYMVDGFVHFLKEAEPYLIEWFETRKRVYKFLLLNPQEFAGKYMLTEAMDVLFEYSEQNPVLDRVGRPVSIEWYNTDYELMTTLESLTEVWLPRKELLCNSINTKSIRNIIAISNEIDRKHALQKYLQSLELMTAIKEKGRSGNSNRLQLDDGFIYEVGSDESIVVKDRNMEFLITSTRLYKVITGKQNPSQTVARLMTGDLYDCLSILETDDADRYESFVDYQKRILIEAELEARIRREKGFSAVRIGLHPILDKKKTKRQLSVVFSDNTRTLIGDCSSSKLLIGVFLKNEPYGLSGGTPLSARRRGKLQEIVFEFFNSFFKSGAREISMYDEVNEYGY